MTTREAARNDGGTPLQPRRVCRALDSQRPALKQSSRKTTAALGMHYMSIENYGDIRIERSRAAAQTVAGGPGGALRRVLNAVISCMRQVDFTEAESGHPFQVVNGWGPISRIAGAPRELRDWSAAWHSLRNAAARTIRRTASFARSSSKLRTSSCGRIGDIFLKKKTTPAGFEYEPRAALVGLHRHRALFTTLESERWPRTAGLIRLLSAIRRRGGLTAARKRAHTEW